MVKVILDMEPIKFFDSLEHLEPKCPGCGQKLDYGLTTDWDDELETQVCISCRTPL